MKKIFVIFLLFFFISSCNKRYGKEFFPPPEDKFTQNSKTIAVLPFKNLTEQKGLAGIIRNSFYSHLTVRAFKDIELSKVDNTLKELHITNIEETDNKTIALLRKKLLADYLVFGSAKANNKVYLGLYSLNSIEVEIKIVDTKTFETVWHDSVISKKHDGGIPTSIIDIPFISFSSSMNIRDAATIDLVESTCRTLTYRIPSCLIEDKTPDKHNAKYFLQVGAFIDKNKSLALLKRLRNMELPVFIKTFNNKGNLWHRVLLGPFESLQETNMLKNKIKETLKINSIIRKILYTK